MADTNVQDEIGRGPATPPLADMAEEPVPVTAQTNAPASGVQERRATGKPTRRAWASAHPAP